MRPCHLLVFPLLSGLLPVHAHAAASLLVDDAGTTPEQQCQLETWYRPPTHGAELTAVGACTTHGNEWSFGASHLRQAGSLPWSLGLKRTLRGTDHAALQIAVAASWADDLHQAGAGALSLQVPVTVRMPPAGRLQLHGVLGWHRTRGARGPEFGAGAELQASPQWSLLLEQARDSTRARRTQAGLRRYLRNDASIDLLVGRNHHDRTDRWLTLGLNLPLAR